MGGRLSSPGRPEGALRQVGLELVGLQLAAALVGARHPPAADRQRCAVPWQWSTRMQGVETSATLCLACFVQCHALDKRALRRQEGRL